MACYRPLVAYRDVESGEVRFSEFGGRRLELPCGKCIGCKLDRAQAWSVRIRHEAQLYDSNLFVTLDYAPEYLPESLSLEYVDFQRFMKRLRRRVGGFEEAPNGRRVVRFFCAGEYGAKFRRPHWHVILFNVALPDQVLFRNGTWRSDVLESLWGKGHAVIGKVTPQSAAYVAGYTLEKASSRTAYEDVVNLSTGELTSRRPEFVTMSRRPGIGAWWYERFGRDLWRKDSAVVEAVERKVPRYYLERLKVEDPLAAEEVSYERELKAMRVDPHESSEERRAVREEFAVRRSERLSREH